MESMNRYTGRRDITEIPLKTALNTIQSINQSILTARTNVALGEVKTVAVEKIKVFQKITYIFDRLENIVRKGEYCWLPAFSPFTTMFLKVFLV